LGIDIANDIFGANLKPSPASVQPPFTTKTANEIADSEANGIMTDDMATNGPTNGDPGQAGAVIPPIRDMVAAKNQKNILGGGVGTFVTDILQELRHKPELVKELEEVVAQMLGHFKINGLQN